jgi:hypothetical protein
VNITVIQVLIFSMPGSLIAGTVWAGNIEIHTKSSHFDNHGHQNDPAFNNVILHIVAENDKRVFNAKGEEFLQLNFF